MYIDYTPEERAFQAEMREYFAKLMTPELRAEFEAERDFLGGPVYRKIIRRMGADGRLGVGWPRAFGGQERPLIEQFIFYYEALRARVPFPVITVNTVGPTLMQFGTEEQKRKFLPAILAGEVHFAIGYSEPEAGTDLASLKTRAVKDGDEWVINGQKIWTTHGNDADYVWLAARTDPNVPKHKGITIFIVPTGAPGYRWSPIVTMGGERTNATYYEDVRVPASAIVAGEGMGWKLLTTQLNHERFTLAAPGLADRLFEETAHWAREADAPEGGKILDREWVRIALARVYAKLDALRVLNWRVAWGIQTGNLDPADASAVKVLGTEFFVEAYKVLLEIVGPRGLVRHDGASGAIAGLLERAWRAAFVMTFGGGTNEIQRDIIAQVGLKMPRSDR